MTQNWRLIPTSSLLLALLCGVVENGHAQVNEALWIVKFGYVGDAVVTTGFHWYYTPAPEVRTDPVTGRILPVSSRTSLHASGTGGISLGNGGEHSVDWTALASIGFVRPIASGPLSGAGLIAMGALQPNAIGPGVRVESGFHAFGINAAVLFSEHATRGAATVDIASAFLRDLFR